MLFSCFIRFIPLLIILLATSSQAIFFHLAKNGILDLLKTFREKKELKKSISNIHHYHVHYYPLFVHSHQSSLNTIHAPTSYELNKIHINQMESVGWSDNKLNNIPEPSIYHVPVKHSWSSFMTYSNPHWNSLVGSNVDRRSESQYDSGILIRVPRNQQPAVQKSALKEEQDSNPLMTFFEKLGDIKNSIFDTSSDTSYDQTEKTDDKLNAFYIYDDSDKS